MTTNLSIIIPVFNDKHRLQQCIKSLLPQIDRNPDTEILVVDNNSEDNVQDLDEFSHPRVRYLLESVIQGSYAARNLGITYAEGEFLLFTDTDCLPDKHWVDEAKKQIARAKQQGYSQDLYVGGQIRFMRNHMHFDAVELFQLVAGFQQRRYLEAYHFSTTANLLVHRSLFRRLGRFKSDLISGGDVEFGHRIFMEGIKLNYAANLLIYHPFRPSKESLEKKADRVSRGLLDLHTRGYSTFRWYYLLLNLKSMARQLFNIALFHDRRFGIKARLHASFLVLHINLAKLRTPFNKQISLPARQG